MESRRAGRDQAFPHAVADVAVKPAEAATCDRFDFVSGLDPVDSSTLPLL
jgi:hypothetical protein